MRKQGHIETKVLCTKCPLTRCLECDLACKCGETQFTSHHNKMEYSSEKKEKTKEEASIGGMDFSQQWGTSIPITPQGEIRRGIVTGPTLRGAVGSIGDGEVMQTVTEPINPWGRGMVQAINDSVGPLTQGMIENAVETLRGQNVSSTRVESDRVMREEMMNMLHDRERMDSLRPLVNDSEVIRTGRIRRVDRDEML